MKLFSFALIALTTLPLAASAQTVDPLPASAAQKFAQLSPEKQALATDSARYNVYVTRPDGSLFRSADSDVASVQAFVNQAKEACYNYELDAIGNGSVATAAAAAHMMYDCMNTNVQKNKVQVLVRLIEPPASAH